MGAGVEAERTWGWSPSPLALQSWPQEPPHSERFLSLALPEEMGVGEKRGLEGQEGLGGVFREDPWDVWPGSVLAGLTAPRLWLVSVSEHYCACAEPQS